MTRLAVVVAVSENDAPLVSLRACARDGEAFAAVLKETGRFDEIVTLSKRDETSSKEVKSAISSLVERYRGKPVEEFVFYFSGHGDFSGDEFYHILSDYNSSRKNQTSLTNSELDGLVRSLSPQLFAKFVDACNSGTNYIKSDNDLGDYLKASNQGFKDVYFFYSSQADQVSWTDGELSLFTKSVLSSIANYDRGTIRYRDIISAASDFFEVSGKQTPHFVTQGSFTEVFCEASAQLQNLVKGFLGEQDENSRILPDPQPSKDFLSIVDRVRELDTQFFTREDASAVLEGLLTNVKSLAFGSEVSELYTLSFSEIADHEPDMAAIGEWLDRNETKDFFAATSYKSVTYKRRVPKKRSISDFHSRLAALNSIYDKDTDYDLVDATRRVPSGFRLTTSLPFETLTVRLEPKFKALAPEECIIKVLVSRRRIQLFWIFRHFKYSDWNTTAPDNAAVQWETEGTVLGDKAGIKGLVSRICSGFEDFVRKGLVERFPEGQQIDLRKPDDPPTNPKRRRSSSSD